MHGEERQELARAILADQGLRLDPKDQDSADLIDSLEGHALMMRAILPKLATQSAAGVTQALAQYVPQADSHDPVERKLYATLRYVEDGLPAELKPLLYPIGLHEGYVYTHTLSGMSIDDGLVYTVQQTQQALERLQAAGLAHGLGKGVFRLHPALSRHLRARAAREPRDPRAEAWQLGFIAVEAQGHAGQVRAIYHQLGRVAEEGRQFEAAEGWYRKSLAIAEQQGNAQDATRTYFHLGTLAKARRDFDAAEGWHRKSLEVDERSGNEEGVAASYHQLGQLAEERRDLDAAEILYGKALEITERHDNKQHAALTYHQLGIPGSATQGLRRRR